MFKKMNSLSIGEILSPDEIATFIRNLTQPIYRKLPTGGYARLKSVDVVQTSFTSSKLVSYWEACDENGCSYPAWKQNVEPVDPIEADTNTLYGIDQVLGGA